MFFFVLPPSYNQQARTKMDMGVVKVSSYNLQLRTKIDIKYIFSLSFPLPITNKQERKWIWGLVKFLPTTYNRYKIYFFIVLPPSYNQQSKTNMDISSSFLN